MTKGIEVDLAKTELILSNVELLGRHSKIKDVLSMIERVGPSSGRVLITGESGTGKELVAKGIHLASPRAKHPMIKVNCASIPRGLMESELFGHEKGAFTGAIKSREGVFERANCGTLFLDEIAELDLDMQAKLLRVLQSGEFTRVGGERLITTDVRLIAATNRDLKAMVASGDFREDLYYRLNVVAIHTPSLRERLSDVLLLADHFLRIAIEENSLGAREFSKTAKQELLDYHWPGNVRELKNVVERVAILSPNAIIDHVEDLVALRKNLSTPESQQVTSHNSANPTALQLSVDIMAWNKFHDYVDKQFLQFVMQKANGNVSEASRLLDLERAYLHRLLKKHGLQRDVHFS